MEILDVVDEYGEPTGQTVDRTTAHSEGFRHRTSHVWLIREVNDTWEVFLQKRTDDKDSYPGCYDISSAGHIPAGVGFEESAVRELQEELGISVSEKELVFCGQCYDKRVNNFHGKEFVDDQVSNIYLLMWRDTMNITLQEEEVSGYLWIEINECMKQIGDGILKHCIRLNELEMVRRKLKASIKMYPPVKKCEACGGRCCKSLGCSLSPGDLIKRLGRTTIDKESLLDVIIKNNFAIDRFSAKDGYLYFLRMKHKCFTFIGVDAYGECIALGENGCLFSDDDRPEGGRRLIPYVDGGCHQSYLQDEMYSDWRPYKELLSEIWQEYERKFEMDGTFDACEEAYINMLRERNKG